MQQCPNCGHHNRAGVVFCENCGASLIGKLPLDTKSLEASSEEEKARIGVDASVLMDVRLQGTNVFDENASIRLEIEGSPEPILFKPKPENILGRRDPATGAMPDVDLTPFAGYRMGVSRRHAAIRRGDDRSLDLWDLGSSNGTFLNGERLSAHRPYRLHDGDELRLGQMVLRLRFEPVGEATATPAPQAPAPSPDQAPQATAPEKKPQEEPKTEKAAPPAGAAAATDTEEKKHD
jgi:hypothetical protein